MSNMEKNCLCPIGMTRVGIGTKTIVTVLTVYKLNLLNLKSRLR